MYRPQKGNSGVSFNNAHLKFDSGKLECVQVNKYTHGELR